MQETGSREAEERIEGGGTILNVVDPGHIYWLSCLDGGGDKLEMPLVFVKREGPNYPGNKSHYPGTTTQEVIRALIDRAKYVNNQQPHNANLQVIRLLRWALVELEKRAAGKHNRVVPDEVYTLEIENLPTCKICFHLEIWHKGDEHASSTS
jgi:hypothetical protein